MVPREHLEESVVRTGRDFPAGGNPCLLKGLTCIQALHLLEVKKKWGNVEFEDLTPYACIIYLLAGL